MKSRLVSCVSSFIYSNVFERDLSFSLFTVPLCPSFTQLLIQFSQMNFLRVDKNIEHRIYLKFCIANGISCAESLEMLQKAYGESTLWKTRAYEWYSELKSGRDVVKDLPRSGRPSTSSTEVNIDKVKEMVTENRYLNLRGIAAELSVSHESIRTILNDCLGMKRAATRLVPKDHFTRLSLWTNFCLKTQWISSNNQRIHLIRLQPTFFSF